MNAELNQNILHYLTKNGMINLDDVRDKMRNEEIQRVLEKKHKYKIFLDTKDNRWKTTVPDDSKKSGRRLIARKEKKDLENILYTLYTKEEDEKYISLVDPTLMDIYPEWLVYRSNLTRSSSTIKRYKSVWNTWYNKKEISQKHISDFDKLYLNKWANLLVKDNNLDRKQYYLITSITKQMLDYAVDKGYIEHNVFKDVEVSNKMFRHTPKQKNETQVFLEAEQELISQTAHEKITVRPWCITPYIVLLNFQLGLRIGELVSLKWEDIDGDYLTIQRAEVTDYDVSLNGVESNGFKIVDYVKTEAGYREIYLNSVAKDLLNQLRKVCLQYGYYDDGFIFIASRTKRRGNQRTLSKYLADLCKAASVTQKSNHKIRKTFISSLFDYNLNINTIREVAGHEDERTSLHNYCFDQSDRSAQERKLELAANTKMAL